MAKSSAPAVTVVAPVKVFATERIVVPAPFWVKPPAPLMTPPSVFVIPAPSAPATVPALAILFEKLDPVAMSKASVPLAAVDTVEPVAIEPLVPLPICSVPADTVVAPV